MPLDPQGLTDLSTRLGSAAFRREFANTPLSALERAGIDLATVPQTAVDALAELSPEELQVVGNLQTRLANDPELVGFTGGVIF